MTPEKLIGPPICKLKVGFPPYICLFFFTYNFSKLLSAWSEISCTESLLQVGYHVHFFFLISAKMIHLFLRIGLGQIDFYISIYVLETFTVLMILNWKTKFGQWDDVWYVPSWIKLLKFSQAI